MTSSLDIANASGFPLQIAVENRIRDTKRDHHWEVLHREHAWALEDESGFIDLVLQNTERVYTLVSECKRVRDAEWVFLPWNGDTGHRRHVNAWVTWYTGDRIAVHDWHDLTAEPSCPEATYCAIRGQDPGGQRSLLERVGGELILSTEALANERRDFRSAKGQDVKVYTTAIITTAALKIARFKPSAVALGEGKLPSDTDFEDVPFVRFRKQLTPRGRTLSPDDYANRHELKARENTVFVVNADEGLIPFLTSLEFDNDPLKRLCKPR